MHSVSEITTRKYLTSMFTTPSRFSPFSLSTQIKVSFCQFLVLLVVWTHWLFSELQISACSFICTIRLLSEASTPFVNGRWILLQLELRDSLLYNFNRHLTYYAFLFFRIATIPVYWSISYYYFNTSQFGRCSWSLIAILFVSGIALDLLNVQWFSRLKQGSLI